VAAVPPPPPPPPSGKGAGISSGAIGFILAAVLAVVVIGLIITRASGDDPVAATTTTAATASTAATATTQAPATTAAPVPTAPISVFALQPGDCFDDQDTTNSQVTEVPIKPCSEPHDNEIYFEFSMTEATFPGTDQTLEIAGQRCLDEFEGFVGIGYLDSALEIFPITPTEQSWSQGDRVVYCVLYALDLSKLEGSMQGSRR
jgi:hypothetical protein